jgi:hypothetical protein
MLIAELKCHHQSQLLGPKGWSCFSEETGDSKLQEEHPTLQAIDFSRLTMLT